MVGEKKCDENKDGESNGGVGQKNDLSIKCKQNNKTEKDKNKKLEYCRRFTDEETKLLCSVLTDPENSFLAKLEKLALKNAGNNDVFERIKSIYDSKLNDPTFVRFHEQKYYTTKDGSLTEYEKLDTSIIKLRAKIKNLKTSWKKRHDYMKNGTKGDNTTSDPTWYQMLNPVFSETVHLPSDTGETSNNQVDQTVNSDSDLSMDFEEEVKFNIAASNEDTSIDWEENNRANTTGTSKHENWTQTGPNENGTQPRPNENWTQTWPNENLTQSRPNENWTQTRPKERWTQTRPNEVNISDFIANGMKLFTQSQMRRQKMWIDEEKAREERERQFRREEAEKERAHEIRIAEIYANAYLQSMTPSYSDQRPTMNGKR